MGVVLDAALSMMIIDGDSIGTASGTLRTSSVHASESLASDESQPTAPSKPHGM